jgi:hypothetical protein
MTDRQAVMTVLLGVAIYYTFPWFIVFFLL